MTKPEILAAVRTADQPDCRMILRAAVDAELAAARTAYREASTERQARIASVAKRAQTHYDALLLALRDLQTAAGR